MTELAPNCYICRLTIQYAKEAPENLLIVGLAMGYVTRVVEGQIEWTGNDLCPRHEDKFKRAMSVIQRRLTTDDPCSDSAKGES